MFEEGYVAARSGHSRGSTVDLTLYHLTTGELAPMGGDHDLMDSISHHGAKGITQAEAGTVDAYAPSWRPAVSARTIASGGITR
jgi:D-alanyl-D-alanine dipeptidase